MSGVEVTKNDMEPSLKKVIKRPRKTVRNDMMGVGVCEDRTLTNHTSRISISSTDKLNLLHIGNELLQVFSSVN